MNPDATDATHPPRAAPRRRAAAAGAVPLAGCASSPPSLEARPPIVFVPGNGDTAALWTTTIWRFESNGWPRERLQAIDIPYPLARDDDTRSSPAARSTAEHMPLAAEVKQGARRDRRAAASSWSATRAAAMRSATSSPTAAARGWCRTPCSAACRTTASSPTRASCPATSSTAPGPFLTRAQRAAGRGGPGGQARHRLADDPLRQQRQVRPARRRLDRPARARRPTSSFDGPALKGAREHGPPRRRPPRDLVRRRRPSQRVPLHHRPRAGHAGDRAGSPGRARRRRQRPRPRQPAGRLREQPAARRRDGRGLRDRRRQRRAARRRRSMRRRSAPTADGDRSPPTPRRATSSWSPRPATRRRMSTARPSRARRRSSACAPERLADADRGAVAVVG